MRKIKLPIYDIELTINDDGTHRMTWAFDVEKRLEGAKHDIANHIIYAMKHAEDRPEFGEESIRLIEECVKRELANEAYRNANPKVGTVQTRYFRLNSKNLTKMEVLISHTCLYFRLHGLETDFSFYLTIAAAKHFLRAYADQDEPSVWYDDLAKCVNLNYMGIHVAPTMTGLLAGGEAMFTIEMRLTELKTMFNDIIDIHATMKSENRTDKDFDALPYVKLSNELSVPNLIITIDERAKAIMEAEDNVNHGIGECVERVLLIANNASYGQDDPVEVVFCPESPRDLYWNIQHITTDKRVMNGGIVFSGWSKSYGVHT